MAAKALGNYTGIVDNEFVSARTFDELVSRLMEKYGNVSGIFITRVTRGRGFLDRYNPSS